jgi:hypothetical protein
MLQIATVQLREGQPTSRCAASLRGVRARPSIVAANANETITMLNVRDECDLPDDDGYDLFTRETEFERLRRPTLARSQLEPGAPHAALTSDPCERCE